MKQNKTANNNNKNHGPGMKTHRKMVQNRALTKVDPWLYSYLTISKDTKTLGERTFLINASGNSGCPNAALWKLNSITHYLQKSAQNGSNTRKQYETIPKSRRETLE